MAGIHCVCSVRCIYSNCSFTHRFKCNAMMMVLVTSIPCAVITLLIVVLWQLVNTLSAQQHVTVAVGQWCDDVNHLLLSGAGTCVAAIAALVRFASSSICRFICRKWMCSACCSMSAYDEDGLWRISSLQMRNTLSCHDDDDIDDGATTFELTWMTWCFYTTVQEEWSKLFNKVKEHTKSTKGNEIPNPLTDQLFCFVWTKPVDWRQIQNVKSEDHATGTRLWAVALRLTVSNLFQNSLFSNHWQRLLHASLYSWCVSVCVCVCVCVHISM